MRFAVLVFTAAVLAAAPAFAQVEPTAPPSPVASETTSDPVSSGEGETAGATESNDGGEQICRTVARTESRLRNRRERICATRAQWEQMQRDAANDVRRAGSIAPRPRD